MSERGIGRHTEKGDQEDEVEHRDNDNACEQDIRNERVFSLVVGNRERVRARRYLVLDPGFRGKEGGSVHGGGHLLVVLVIEHADPCAELEVECCCVESRVADETGGRVAVLPGPGTGSVLHEEVEGCEAGASVVGEVAGRLDDAFGACGTSLDEGALAEEGKGDG